MSHLFRAMLAASMTLAVAPRALASVQIVMTVEGPRGPFTTKDIGVPNAMKVVSVQVDFGVAAAAALVAPKPVVITRAIDDLSWQFLDAVASSDPLRVVITVAQAARESTVPIRRVVTLTNARILSIHASMNATAGSPSDLGFETISFTYERIVVEDDGARVFASGS